MISEVGTDKSKVSFSMLDPEFDTTTYIGRFKEFQKVCNPFLSFYSNGQII